MHHSSPYAAVEASYRWIDYRLAYAQVLERHGDPPACLLELFVFRVWLAQFALLRVLDGAPPARQATPRPPWWLLSKQAEATGVTRDAAHAGLAALLEQRFGQYDAAARAGTPDDPLGLEAAAATLAGQLFGQPDPSVVDALARRARGQYAGIAQAYDAERPDAR